MEKAAILHLITAAKNPSPFDVNMAYDAGFDQVVPYSQISLSEVTGLVQDAIFSRSPSGLKREGIFIGGRDIDVAMDMLNVAQKAMFPPFQVSIMADPSGAFTTAAAMLAKVDFHLKQNFHTTLAHKRVAIFGATGAVGGCAAVIAAQQGAVVELVAHHSIDAVRVKAQNYQQRYAVNFEVVDGTHDAAKQDILSRVEIVLCAAAAGVQVISAQQVASSKTLQIVADVNAVAPAGVEGVDVLADGANLEGTHVLGIGALAIGQLKYNTQHYLLKQMLSVGQANAPKVLEFTVAFEMARGLISHG